MVAEIIRFGTLLMTYCTAVGVRSGPDADGDADADAEADDDANTDVGVVLAAAELCALMYDGIDGVVGGIGEPIDVYMRLLLLPAVCSM